MKTLHLFAGAGGGLLSDLILGHQPIAAVEWEPYACQVLRERAADGWFPGLRVHEGDVRLFDSSEYAGKISCIHAGFPCQDISVAGNQAGIGEDSRSGLYREVLRIADEVRPGYIFLENVAAIVTGADGAWLRTIIGDLAERGFDAVWCCLAASQIGAAHRRNRWWLLGYPKHAGCSATEIGEGSDSGNDSNATRAKQASEPSGSGEQHENVAYSESERAGDVSKDNRQAGGKINTSNNASSTCRRLDRQSNWEAVGYPASESGDGGRIDRENGAAQTPESGSAGGQGYVPDTNSESAERLPSRETQEHAELRSSCEHVANANKPHGKRNERTERGESQPAEHEQFSGWQTKSSLGGMADDMAHRMDVHDWVQEEAQVGRTTTETENRANRLKALGNGQVPLQAAVAFSILWEMMEAANE